MKVIWKGLPAIFISKTRRVIPREGEAEVEFAMIQLEDAFSTTIVRFSELENVDASLPQAD